MYARLLHFMCKASRVGCISMCCEETGVSPLGTKDLNYYGATLITCLMYKTSTLFANGWIECVYAGVTSGCALKSAKKECIHSRTLAASTKLGPTMSAGASKVRLCMVLAD